MMERNEELVLSAGMVAPLLKWYENNKRSLPWRENPTPYGVWISEIMLQQTRVEAVKPYFERFMQEIPDIETLAGIEEDKLMKLWEGLGYYNRARNLKAAAQMIEKEFGGELPRFRNRLLKLPGIGAYTAGAIASIAYGRPVSAVDGNVLRVVSRLLAYDGDIRKEKSKRMVGLALENIYPPEQSGDFTQSLMELGATICVPGEKPKCMQCPLVGECQAFQRSAVDEYPAKAVRKQRKVEEYTIFLLYCEDRLAVRKRAEQGLLPGVWELPNRMGNLSTTEAEEHLNEKGVTVESMFAEKSAKHIFTHVEWRMQAYRVQCAEETDNFIWVGSREMEEEIALPSAFRYWKMF